MAGPGRRPMVGHEKPDNLFKTYASIIKDMKKEWKWLIFIIVLLTVNNFRIATSLVILRLAAPFHHP
jgi:hypothetical protein